MSAATVRALTFAEPRWPERHGPHNGTATGPALPALPRWTWAAMALPVRPWNVRRQASVPPDAFLVSPAANVPPAPAFTPAGLGTSLPAERVAFTAIASASGPSR